MNNRITDTAKAISTYIENKWGHLFDVDLETPLRTLFPEPDNCGLKHIWKYGSADIVVRKKGIVICIIEPGGGQHFEEKQSKNDSRKWKLCELNGVRCLTMMNGVMEQLSNRKWRSLLGRYLFGINWGVAG